MNYEYDLFGNRLQKQLQNGGNPFAQVWVEDGAFNQSTNRFNSGVTYDDAGNITVDSRFRNLAFQYDANNRQKQSSATDGSAAVVSVYDAGGQRVATQVNNQLMNVLVYDASGKLIAEYGSTPAEANGTQYVTADHQGSPRAITNGSGAVVSRHDYAPFGEDLPAGIGMRSTPGQGYSQPDAVRQKYAGMENDDATGMSHTLWRQYDSRSGRWTAPDPYGGSMDTADPQTFNRYSYVENDPVNQTDPLGLMSGRDASQSWGDVAGLFWGGSGSFGGPETGRSIIAAAEARHDRWVDIDMAGGDYGDDDYPPSYYEEVSVLVTPFDPEDHDKILADALASLLTPGDLSDVQSGSRAVDLSPLYNTLNPLQAYLHGMVPQAWIDWYGPEKAMTMAMNRAAAFVRHNLADAEHFMKKAARSPFKDEAAALRRLAYRAFGMAMHPVMDAFSPTHQYKGYGVPLNPFRFLRELRAHKRGEAGGPDRTSMSIMRGQIQLYFAKTFVFTK